MWEETRTTNVEFTAFWLDHVESGVAYFFCWLGPPRATVLAIWSDDNLQMVECRGTGDREIPAADSRDITVEIHQLFTEAGYGVAFEGRA
jgi:hypothetical protein